MRSEGARESSGNSEVGDGRKVGIRHRLLLYLPVLGLLVITAMTYPTAVSFSDEASYLGQAWTFHNGRLYPSELGARIVNDRPAVEGERTSYFPPGVPTVLAPIATARLWRSAFLLGFFSLLALWAAALSLCRSIRISDYWSWAWLLYPPFILYSRTAMSDVPTTAGTLGVLALLSRRRPVLAGLVLAALMWMRIGNAAIVLLFLGVAFGLDLRGEASFSKWIAPRLAAGPLISGLGIMIYGQVALGSPIGLLTGYGSAGFSAHGFAGRLGFYLVCLLLLYPGMLVAVLSRSSSPADTRWYVGTVGVGLVVFYSAYLWLVTTPLAGGVSGAAAIAARPIYGMRFVLPAAALLMLPYVGWLDGIAHRLPGRSARVLATICVCGMLIGAAVISTAHQKFANSAARIRSTTVDLLPPGSVLGVTKKASRYASPVWGVQSAIPVDSQIGDPPDGSDGIPPSILDIGADEFEREVIDRVSLEYHLEPVDLGGGTLWIAPKP